MQAWQDASGRGVGLRGMGLRHAVLGVCVLTAALVGGCPTPMSPGDPNSDSNTPGAFLDSENNGSIATASKVSLAAQGNDEIMFDGAIERGDLDFYSLGTFSAGDRIHIDIQATSGDLDPIAGVFDADEKLQAFSDDRQPEANNLNPLLDFQVRGGSRGMFLGLTAYPGSGTSGDYMITIQITRGLAAPGPAAQVVLLNFAGGSGITVPNVGTFNITPFDSADLSPLFTGLSQQMKARIKQVVQSRFNGFNITIASTDDASPPATPFSTVYFGGTNRLAFGIAEKIDTYNTDQSDEAIIFVSSFRDAFSITPSFEQMVTALSNTTAHEIGHLLGLVHTKDCAGLMDTSCGNDSLLTPQAFKLSQLDNSVFPTGFQDAVELLGWVLGFVGM